MRRKKLYLNCLSLHQYFKFWQVRFWGSCQFFMLNYFSRGQFFAAIGKSFIFRKFLCCIVYLKEINFREIYFHLGFAWISRNSSYSLIHKSKSTRKFCGSFYLSDTDFRGYQVSPISWMSNLSRNLILDSLKLFIISVSFPEFGFTFIPV